MTAILDFDEENARRLVAVYTTPDVIEQRRAIRAALALQPGERVLDIGSGPGFLAAEMAEEVGPDGAVHGIDSSDSMLAIARRQDGRGRLPLRRRARAAVRRRALRRRRLHAGLRVRRRRRRGAGRGAARAAPRRPAARAGHRLGLDRLALERPRADGARARRLERAPRRSRTCRGGSRGCSGPPASSRWTSAIIPILNVGADRNTYSAGMSGLSPRTSPAAAASARPRRPHGSRTSPASARTTSSASTATFLSAQRS